MARTPKKQASDAAAKLREAIEFVALAQKREGELDETHCFMANKWVVSFDRVVAMGHPISEPLYAGPRTHRLLDFLRRCGDDLSITQPEPDKLLVRSGKLKVIVPCVPIELSPNVVPDTPIVGIDDSLIEAVRIAMTTTNESGPRVVDNAILMRTHSCVGTNGKVLFERAHNCYLPPICVPKRACVALLKVKKPLVAFGYSNDKTATFWFEDQSYLRTQLYGEKYPDTDKLFASMGDMFPLDASFAEGVEALKPHGDYVCMNGQIMFTAERADETAAHGSTYECACPSWNLRASLEYLAMLAPHATQWGPSSNETMMYFTGEGCRIALAGAQ